MSEFEVINKKTAERREASRQEAAKLTAHFLIVVLFWVLVIAGLWGIDFISNVFALVLISVVCLRGAFKAGQAWKINN